MADDLRLVAKFDDKASAGVRKLGKDLAGVKPTHGMAQAQKWFAEFRGTVGQTEKLVKPISGYMGAIGVTGLAASLSIGEMVKQFKELANQTLALKEIGRQTGLTTTEVKRLKYAASELSIDPDKMVAGLQVMSDKMADFHRGASELNGLLNNFDPDFSRKLMGDKDDPQKELKDIVDWLAQIPAKQRAAGKSAADAAQAQRRWTEAFLGDGGLARLAATPGEFAAAMADATKAVPEVTKEMEEQAKRLNQSVLSLNQSWEKMKNELGPSVIDPMVQTIDKLDAAFRQLSGIVASPTPEAAPPRKANGDGGESTGGYFARTFRNSLRATFQGNEMAADGQWLWDQLFGVSKAHAEEAPPQFRRPATSAFHTDDDRASRARPGEFSWVKNTDGNALRRNDDALSPVTAQELFRPATSAFHTDDDRLSRARSSDFVRALDTDGNALHKHDDELSPVTAQELFQKVREGSKEGIVAGLREMAQEQDLDPKHDGLGGVGAPSLRYGRDPASGGYRRGGHSGGGRGYADTPEGQGRAGDVKGGMAMRAMAAMKYLVEKKGYTPEGAAIAVGNAMQESSVNAGTRPGDHGISHSMFQWNHERWAAYQKFSAERGKNTSDNENALDFFDEERKHRSGLEAQWHKQANLHNAGRLGHLFEGYGDNSEGTRVQNARNMLDLWKKQHPGATPPAHASGGPISGPGGPRSDSIFAMLSNGEFVVNARDAQRHAGLLHAINSGGLPAFADGGLVAAGRARRKSWLDFFHRSMGASQPVALGATAMMMGESGPGLNPGGYHWDVNGPSGGTAQWHDKTQGRGSRVHRLSDLAAMAVQQHEDWARSVPLQQAFWKREAAGPLRYAWDAMRHAKTAAGALKAGIDKFEVPADKLGELHKRLPNIVRLAREAGGDAARSASIDPIDLHIHHHENGRIRSVRASGGGKGVRVHLNRGPTFASASETD